MTGNTNGDCPQDFTPFLTLSCANSSLPRSCNSLRHCLIAKDVARLGNCGNMGDYRACTEV
jgi:hypothetical protein